MATTVGELKIHITTCGIPELEHLLGMLQANIAVLPGVVVKAMQALADSTPSEPKSVEIQPLEIKFGDGADIGSALKSIAAECHRASIAHGVR